MKLSFFKGDIARFSADAIVLPANELLREGSGASTAIFQAAGRKELTAACKKIGHCDVGKAVPTKAFHMDADFIIHAVVPKWVDGNHNEYDLLSSAYLSSLYIADAMGCNHIAFPLLASGNNGFDLTLALEIAIKSIDSFEGRSLKQASIILYEERIVSAVQKMGYDVVSTPETQKDASFFSESQEHNNLKKIGYGYRKAAGQILEQALNQGLAWIQDPDNQKKVLAMGESIFLFVIGARKRK